jgi:wobble nucleotide-excising tRNase
MFKKIVIRNVGVLKAFEAGSSPHLSPLSLFYARNGRGKTTLSAVLRAARDGNAGIVLARRSLGNNAAEPQVTLVSDDSNQLFKDGVWQHKRAPIEVFDAEFIADNIFAGEMTTLEHDRGLFSVIVGEEGVRLNRLLERFKEHAKKTGASLKAANEALAEDMPNDLTREEFFALAPSPAHQQRLERANQVLRSVQEADKVSVLNSLEKVEIPMLPSEIENTLAATVPHIDISARDRLAEHFRQFELGKRGEAWIDFGMEHLVDDKCPFCARPDADELGMVTLYGQIFGEEYKTHLGNIRSKIEDLNNSLSEDVRTSIIDVLARNVEVSKKWSKYGQFTTQIPVCASLTADLKEAHDEAMAVLVAKRASPLEPLGEPSRLETAKEAINRAIAALESYNSAIDAFNEETNAIRSRSIGSEDDAKLVVANAQRRIARTENAGVQQRILAYLSASRRDRRAKSARQETQRRLKNANEAAAAHYHEKVNDYLKRFGVSAGITRPKSSMTGNAGSADYSLLIRGEEVARQRGRVSEAVPHFRNTLSSGDKAALALAFFLAKLDRDGDLSKKVVVFDDPLASHDSHRRAKTVEAVKELTSRCSQLILLSHDEYFLRDVERRCGGVATASYRIEYSDGDEWSIAKHVRLSDLCKSNHAKRLDKLAAFVDRREGDPDDIVLHVRQVLETHLRRSYTAYFAHNRNLGNMIRDIDDYSGQHPCAGIRNQLDSLNTSTCDNHHGDDSEAIPRKGVDPDELKVIVTEALEVIGARKP